jgi:hypothetical protein
LTQELALSGEKTGKYKRIAKAFKASFTAIEESLVNLKRMS